MNDEPLYTQFVPTPRGEKNAMVLAAAHIAGVHRVFTVGGAQAVAALGRHHSTPCLTRVDVPTAFVIPAKDHVIPADRQEDYDLMTDGQRKKALRAPSGRRWRLGGPKLGMEFTLDQRVAAYFPAQPATGAPTR